MNYHLTRLRYFVYGHRFILMVVGFVLVVWGSSFAAFAINVHESMVASEAAARAKEEESGKLLEEFRTKRESEQRATEEKAGHEAVAEGSGGSPEAAAPTSAVPERPTTSCNTATSHNNPASIDVLVNKKHCLMPVSFVPSDLLAVHGATLSAKAAADFSRMFTDAAGAGQPFNVSSSYRSYQTQVSTYNHWVSVNGQQGADTVSARPGFSEHQTGFVIDVGAGSCVLNCFGGTSQYRWFQENAAEYGFIQRYHAGYEHITGYSSEEWHYRYVGVGVAKDMKARAVMTLEQYWGLEGGDYH